MQTILCTLYNQTTGHYSFPLPFENKETAVSTFISEIQAPNSEMANIKDTLAIYSIGKFDHKTGLISTSSFKKKQLLLSGKEVLLKPTITKEAPLESSNSNSQGE